ncbi:MAG: hypothetical protein AAGF94_03795 [Pseudomonadota bacterium]
MLTITIGTQSAKLFLLGAFLGDFNAEKDEKTGAIETTYMSSLSAPGPSEGGSEAEGIRGDGLLMGNERDDILRGGDGQDELRDGLGNDALIGSLGTDLLNGGPGADLFLLNDITDADIV